MNFDKILDLYIADTAHTSVGLFRPELILCGTILALLFVRLFIPEGFGQTAGNIGQGDFLKVIMAAAKKPDLILTQGQ